jgi:dihydroflavonol-4-reductase
MIFLTGATGMLGAHIAIELLRAGHSVRALLRRGSSTSTTEALFAFHKATDLYAQLQWINGDLLDAASLDDALTNSDVVIHAAGFVSFQPNDRDLLWKINGQGTANLVDAALRAGVKTFCHISSVATLGSPRMDGFADENSWWKNEPNRSDYAISKYNAEREVWRGMEEGLSVLVLNPSVILGAGDPMRSSNRLFAAAQAKNKWYTEGITGYVDARDIAFVVRLVLNSTIRNERFVLNAENLSYRDIQNQMLAALGYPPTSRCARPWILALAWRVEKIAAMLFRREPRITSITARSAWEKKRYDGKRITEQLPFSYKSTAETIRNASEWYRKF